MVDWNALSPPQREILERYHVLVGQWNENAAEITRLQAKQSFLSQQANDLTVAARVFQFDLAPTYQEVAVQIANITASALVIPATPSASQALSASAPAKAMPVAKPRPVHAIILEMAARAYPERVRASEIREELEKQGIVLHEKTVGMTLYRLSKQGLMERKRKADWFFVPAAERGDAADAAGDEGSSGDQPELQAAAE